MFEADYLQMTTTSIASSGAGAVTCIAETNRPTFTLVFGSQNTDVRYEIEDTVNKKFEAGLGKVASNVLTRTRPQVTWDGTTWNALNPTALTFTGSPTSGDIKIRMAATAEQRGSSMPGRNQTIAGDSSWRDYPWSGGLNGLGNGSGYTLTADREYYAPYKLETAGVLSGVQIDISGAVAASNFKWALYGAGYDGLPGAKIVDFVTTASATTGIKTDTATGSWSPAGKVHVIPGWVWFGFLPSHAIGLRGFNNSNPFQSPTPLGRKDGYGYSGLCYVAGSYATGLPATPSLGSGTMVSTTAPGIPFFGTKVDA